MSYINVTKMWSKSGGTFSSENFDINAAKYAFTEAWQVLCELGDNAADAIVGVPGIPAHGEQHPSGAYSYAKTFNATPMGPTLWVVTVGYEGVSSTNPENDSVDVEWTDTTSTEPIDRDYNGRAIVTVNNEIVTGLTMELADQMCVIRRRFATINLAAIAAYRHATNSDTFLGWPAGTARLIGFSAKNQFSYYAPNEGWDVTARIQFRRGLAGASDAQAWHKRWRHEGFYVKYGSTVRRARDAAGLDAAKPVLLKSNGTEETNPDNAVFYYTQIYGSLPYAALGLV